MIWYAIIYIANYLTLFMNSRILLPLFVIALLVPSTAAFADVRVISDYYEMGDFLEIGGIFDGYTTINITGENDFKKGYKADFNGLYEFGFPITEQLGYTPGIYNVTISHENGSTHTQQFGLDTIIPVFTLYSETSMIPLNEYAFFFGQVIGIEPKDYSFSGNVLISILDSNGNLVEDNWKSDKDTAKTASSEIAATKSKFRVLINNADTFRVTIDDSNIFGDKANGESIRPIQENGYRVYIKLDPTIYKPYHAYTLKAQHDSYVQTTNFMVLDYRDSFFEDNNNTICQSEQKNLNHAQDMYDELIEAEVYGLAEKYKVRIDNFKFSSGCN